MRLALDTTLRSRGAGSARSCASTIALRKQRAQGKPGAHDTRSRAQRCTRRTAGAPEHPAFPAQWFYGLCRALPGDEFVLPPSLTDWRLIEGPVGLDNLHQLDTSNGCQDHTVLPSAASSSHTPRPARMLPEEVSTEAFNRRSSARRSIAHGIRPATTRASDAAASTATRTPRIVTPRTSLFTRREDAKKTSISEKGKRYIFFTQSGRPKSR